MALAAETVIDFGAAPEKAEALAEIRSMVLPCMQCGTCTASCPNEFAMDLTPRHMWRLVLMGQTAEVLASKTFGMCSACYMCTLRCPRGLPLTEAIGRLKQLAAGYHLTHLRAGDLFYRNFVASVRRHGRMHEMEFMTLYFAQMMNPWLPVRYAGVGMRLMRRGKLSVQLPSRGSGKLAKIFEKVAEMEDRP
jgi:heterodisulfide reductase subunit C